MRTWLFQGNPDEYDIDGYLASRPAQIVWLVTRHMSDIAVGDRVYLWRNQGKQKAIAGIIAEGIITLAPELRGEDPEGTRFWRVEGPRATASQVRATMRLVKIATAREVLRRDWFVEDPVLRDLPNLKMQAGTNYPVTLAQAHRLDALWGRTGRDWSRNEAVAGLLTYAETYGQPISRLPGSPVAGTALTIGRAVSGVYAKVMNFRSLDPRAEGKGMSGAGDTDREVWREYFDPHTSTLRIEALQQEYTRLWGAQQPDLPALPEANAMGSIIEDEADRLEALSFDQLLAKYHAQMSHRVERPRTRVLATRSYDRNPLVIALARKRASHKCEILDCQHPIFETPDDFPYIEVHHIKPLADGGEDTIENVACLCPAHHREVHLGRRAAELTAQLQESRSKSAAISSQAS